MTLKKEMNVGELRTRGIVKLRGEDLYSMWVKTACCNLNSEQLRKLADITEKYARGFVLFSTRQIPIIPFIHFQDLQQVEEELNSAYLTLDRCGPTVRNVNVCYEDKICPEAITNSLSLGEKLDKFFHAPMLRKIKLGVAGCQKDCIISRVLNDISFIGTQKDGRRGYDVYVGGRLGVNPFVGAKMAEALSEGECVRFVQNYFDLMTKESKAGERGADLIHRLGEEMVRQELTRGLQENTGLEPIKCQSRLDENEAGKMIIRLKATCGEVTSVQLRTIAGIAQKYGKGFVHFAVRGSPEIPCVGREHLENIRQELRVAGLEILDRGIDNLQSCFGNYCTENNADPQSLLRRVEKLVEDLGLNDLNIRISACGCPNSCGIAHLNDIGFYGVVEPEVDAALCKGCELCVPACQRKAIEIADSVARIDKEKCVHCGQCIAVCPFNAIAETRRGFAVLVGGRQGADTRLGQIIAEFVSEDEAVLIAEIFLRMVKEKKVDMATIIDEVGVDNLREKLVSMAK